MSWNLSSLSELRDTRAEILRFQDRVQVMQWVVLFCFLLLASRLIYLQVVRHDDLLAQAENNRTAILPTVPPRGTILDRNGVVLASNYSAYTLEITPSKVKDLEATINELAELVDIQTKDRRRFKRLREESKSFDSLPIRNRLTDEEVARFSAQSYRFPGVEIKARLFRSYPLGETGSHLLGFVNADHWTIAIPLLEAQGLNVGDNLPYSGRDLNYTMNRHAEAQGRAYLGVELRQDLVQTPETHTRWAALLANIAQRVASALA